MKKTNATSTPSQVPYISRPSSPEDMLSRAGDFYNLMDKRRTVRKFATTPIAKEIIENVIKSAGTAPSGANKQPWTFCAISNIALKREIRIAAEKEEYESYHGRMSQSWLDDLKIIGTNWQKPFLEEAPWLIVVFKKIYDVDEEEKKHHYYVTESVGIACGLLITAIHQAGLVTVTHTPSPMNFLTTILNRPNNERPFLLLPVGLAAEDASTPSIQRKDLSQISEWFI